MFLEMATAAVADPTDVNRDGFTTIDDYYTQIATPADVNINSVIDGADTTALERTLRAGEYAGMKGRGR